MARGIRHIMESFGASELKNNTKRAQIMLNQNHNKTVILPGLSYAGETWSIT
jgi:hypothetical protein